MDEKKNINFDIDKIINEFKIALNKLMSYNKDLHYLLVHFAENMEVACFDLLEDYLKVRDDVAFRFKPELNFDKYCLHAKILVFG